MTSQSNSTSSDKYVLSEDIQIPKELKKLQGKKVLTVCIQGVSRSVALMWMLKNFYGIDALAVGIKANSLETIQMLFDWADVVIITTKEIGYDELPDEYKKKILLWDVGGDRYFMGYHPDLIKQFGKHMEEYEQL